MSKASVLKELKIPVPWLWVDRLQLRVARIDAEALATEARKEAPIQKAQGTAST